MNSRALCRPELSSTQKPWEADEKNPVSPFCWSPALLGHGAIPLVSLKHLPLSLHSQSLSNCHGSSTSHSETSAHFTLLTASSRLAQRAHFYSPERAPLIGRGDFVGGASGQRGGAAEVWLDSFSL